SLAAGLFVVVGLVPGVRTGLVGWWRGEATYRGRYSGAWAEELRGWLALGEPGSPGAVLYARPVPAWRQWLGSPARWAVDEPPLHEGDPAAVPVLVELLRDPDPVVRLV